MTTKKSSETFDPRFRVAFALSDSSLDSLLPWTVLIVPSQEKYKDSEFRVDVDIHVKLVGALELMSISGFFAYVTSNPDERSDVGRLERELRSGGEAGLVDAGKLSGRFFTMLPSLADYRRVVRVIGVDTTQMLLMSINDVVALGELNPRSDISRLASESRVFQRSFTRTSEAFFAYKNAGPILRGLESERFGEMSNDIEVSFQLDGRKNRHRLEFRFEHKHELPKRIAVVIGKNGVGKSQALGNIARAALSGDASSLREASTRGRVLMNRLLAFAPSSESASVFPAERRKTASVWYKRFALNRGGRTRRASGVADIVLQVARSDGYIGNFPRWKIFLTAIQAISEWEQIVLLKTQKEQAPVPLSELRVGDVDDAAGDLSVAAEHQKLGDDLLDLYLSIDGNREPVRCVNGQNYPLSSGEISFLRFAAQTSLYIENGSLLLLDEPETHLHPNFVSQFVALLNSVLTQTGSAAVIATHSAYFVREVFREQVTVLRADSEGYVFSEPLRLQTFGADVGSISYFVFGEDGPSQLASEVESRLLARYQTWDKLYADYKDQLSPEMLGSLRIALESRGAK
ncbi:AAA family ATPase [Burkholderia cenocepacia]|uniref:AAA family ATPase n=1 Tax=Burkholderia cenocepacia TaxID=95486 RepID=A0A6B2MPI9_9BURK|nr:AAA family ATPase [Burkholderia cenocepacia]NDV76731.1 AAA family ATPase [Burkholderia cenocepacia]RQU31307.1 AAA family ATPase [Burkholderia cenocepacia]RQU61701.1 AAA family ATPase [Burkholderia cenocepacia]